MSIINILDDNTINKIAAGEVVEKPSAAVKELVENSIDAGATAITIEIKNGGIDMVRITDNGAGMSPEDVKLSFMRHATSKIRAIGDLTSLNTLGFRGEALASISAVSKTECITKQSDSITGIRYAISGGSETAYEEVGCPDGTTFVVRDIFFNTPARLKFLKSPSTEGSYITDLVEKIALSHPEISFRYIYNGQLKLSTNGSGKLNEVIYRIYGRDITENVIRLDNCINDISIHGYIGKPIISRGNRAMISCFVNGRYIKSPIIYRAIEEAYSGYMMQHKFPFAVLMLDISPDKMDVNVHPSKQEIRFSEGDVVYSAIYNIVRAALKSMELVPKTVLSVKDKTPECAHEETGNQQVQLSTKTLVRERGPEPFEVKRMDSVQTNNETIKVEELIKKEPVQQTLFDAPGMKTEINKDIRLVGCVFSTYWIVEFREEMYIMDQHAAHEKVLYEQFTNSVKIGSIASQPLSPPIVLTLTPQEADIISRHSECLINAGFVVEPFGGNEYIINSVPADLPGISSKAVLMDMLAMLADGSDIKASDTVFMERLATMSCKAAVKGGRHISEKEAYALVKQLLDLDNPFHCPHGRPTMIKMTKYELEKKFGRII